MEVFKREFKDTNHASIFLLSDNHEGHSSHNEEAFKWSISYIETVAKTRTVKVDLLGDLIDCIEVSDKRFNPAEISEKYKLKDLKNLPKKQADVVIEDLKPIKHLIDFAVIGNHEESYIKEHHFDVYDYYCNMLECKKLGFFGIIHNTFSNKGGGSSKFDLGLTHGRGGAGGKLLGYPLNWVKDIFEKFDIDAGFAGHRHKLICQPSLKLGINNALELVYRKKWFGVTGGFLDSYTIGFTNYFEGSMGENSDVGFIQIDADRIQVGKKNGSMGWSFDVKKISPPRID